MDHILILDISLFESKMPLCGSIAFDFPLNDHDKDF